MPQHRNDRFDQRNISNAAYLMLLSSETLTSLETSLETFFGSALFTEGFYNDNTLYKNNSRSIWILCSSQAFFHISSRYVVDDNR